MLLGQMLRQTRDRMPGRDALRFEGCRWTYAELDDFTDRIAVALAAAGVRTGDRVALFLPNCPELVLSYLACFKLGAVAVPLNYRYRQPEAQYALEHSGACALVVHHSLAEHVEGLPLRERCGGRCYLAGRSPHGDFNPFDALLAGNIADLPGPSFSPQQPAAILYTSGTTARPKGVVYTQATLWENCLIQATTFAFTSDDVHLISTAACHAAAFTGQLLPCLSTGGMAVLTHLPTPEQVLTAITEHRVTRVQMLPASLEDLMEHLEEHPPADLSSWRCCTAGGDVVPLELHHRFQRVTGLEITELYGMTEATTCVTNPPFGAKRPGSIGWPVERTQLRLVDERGSDVPGEHEGELLVRSQAMMSGYWNNPAATAEALRDGWLHTGDLARRDADGCCWFVGRKKGIIIRGGSNISPLEVEEILDAHPAVHLSCVVGVPDRHLGQTVAAYVALRPGIVPAPGPEDLRRFVAERTAAYKVPERITILDELPLSPTGKVDRRVIHGWVRVGPGEAPADTR